MRNNIMNQIFLERYAVAATISQLNPCISETRITYAISGKEHENLTLKPESKYMVRVKCPSLDCDSGYIDISDDVFTAVKSGKLIENRKKCSGHLNKYSHNRSRSFDCEAYVEYRIEPVFKKEK